MEGRFRAVATVGLAALLAVSVAVVATGCGAQSGSSTTEAAGHELKVAALLAGTDSTWDTAVKEGLEQEAKKNGVDVTYFDAGYDPEKQFSQLQTAIASGEYNAITATLIAPAQVCKTLQQEGEKGVIVVPMGEPICDVATKPFKEQAIPHITTFVGGGASIDQIEPWAKKIVADNPGKQKILLLTGPKGSSDAQVQEKAMEDAVKGREGEVDLITVASDFTRSSGLTQTQTLLQSNPDISIVAGPVDSLEGALAAIEQNGSAKVSSYIFGGDKVSLELLRAGKVAMVEMDRPKAIGEETGKILGEVQEGKTVPTRVYTPDLEPGRPPAQLLTKENVGNYQSEY